MTPIGVQNLRRFTDGSFTLAVRDSGIGMSEDEIRLALEPFGQVHDALSRYRHGTGLGLPLASQLAQLHGGSLTIQSHPGHGTAVSVHFRAWRVNPASPAPAKEQGTVTKVTKPALKH